MNKNILLFFILMPALLSGVGMGLFFIAVSWFVHNITDSTFDVSLLIISGYIASMLVIPKIGMLCDTMSRKVLLSRIYLVGFLIQWGILAVLWFESWLNDFSFAILLIVSSSIVTCVKTSDQITRSSYVKTIFNQDDYHFVNRWLEGIRQGITFISGFISFIVLNNNSLQTVLSITFITFFMSWVISFYLPVDTMSPKVSKRKGLRDSYNEGLDEFFKLPMRVKKILLLSMSPYVAVVSLNALYPALLISMGGIKYYAVVSIPYGLGALMASIYVKKHAKDFRTYYIVMSSLFYLSMATAYLSKNVWIFYCCLFCMSFLHSAIRIQRNYQIMITIDNNDIGRVITSLELIFTVMVVLITLLIGAIADANHNAWIGWSSVAFLMFLTTYLVWHKKAP